MTDAQPPPAPEQPKKGLVQRFGSSTVWMLLIIMSSIVFVFIGGLLVLVLNAVDMESFDSVAIVAIISPVLTAIGTVAAGVFGYSLGSEGAAEAQKTASQAQQVANTATQEAAVAKQEAAAKIDAAVPLVRTVERILNQQALVDGVATTSGKFEISLDDLKTITAEGAAVSRKLGI